MKLDKSALKDDKKIGQTGQDKPDLSRDRIAERLEQMIVSGEFPPGKRLDERAIADEFDVSRTPVRDAIGRLASIGLIDVKPRSGSYVAKLELGDLFHLFEIMSDLEALCAGHAASRIDFHETRLLCEFAQACAELSSNPDGEASAIEYSKVNLAFHDVIYRACKNPYLESITRQARRRCSAYRNHTLKLPGRMQKSSEEHFAILDAISSGDAGAAQRLMRDHVDIRRDDYSPFIAMIAERQ